MMEKDVLGGLVNSISRFILLVSCQNPKSIIALKDLRNMVSILKFVKPVLDEVCDSEILSNEKLLDIFEELDMLVNEARDTLEKQPHKASKLCNVFRVGSLVTKVQESSLRLCYILQELLQSSPTMLSTCIQQSIEEIQCADQGLTSVLIENALSLHPKEPDKEMLMRIAESVGLTSNHDLLGEWIALEKEKAELDRMRTTMTNEGQGQGQGRGFLNEMMSLFHQIRDCLGKLDQFAMKNGVVIPPYFRCHLSLELMEDPLILASGQTYERQFIQKWLDSGLNICPKTQQPLPHTTLVPNDIVKALIVNWCRENGVRLHHSDESSNMQFSCRCSSGSDDASNESSYHNGSSIEKDLGPSARFRKVGNGIARECRVQEAPSLQVHVRNESTSSINSTTELLGRCSRYRTTSSECTSKDLVLSPWLSSESGRLANLEARDDGRGECVLSVCSESDILATAAHVQKLITDLNGESSDSQATAALELRLLAKDSRENRVVIARCGGIAPLISLLYSTEEKVQENAVTALLNLSIGDNENKAAMVASEAIDPFIHVLKFGNADARGNAAAALFSLSTLEQLRVRIGRSGAIKPLVELLRSGNLRGKKDAAAALFNLSIFHENKARIVRSGATRYLVDLLDPEKGMIDKSVALLANLSTVPEGCLAISQEGGIPLLVEVADTGSQRGKENAASTLLQLCMHSRKLGTMVLQEGAIPPLVALSQQGTPRAKDKAQQILSHFRSLREGSLGKLLKS